MPTSKKAVQRTNILSQTVKCLCLEVAVWVGKALMTHPSGWCIITLCLHTAPAILFMRFLVGYHLRWSCLYSSENFKERTILIHSLKLRVSKSELTQPKSWYPAVSFFPTSTTNGYLCCALQFTIKHLHMLIFTLNINMYFQVQIYFKYKYIL